MQELCLKKKTKLTELPLFPLPFMLPHPGDQALPSRALCAMAEAT